MQQRQQEMSLKMCNLSLSARACSFEKAMSRGTIMGVIKSRKELLLSLESSWQL
jgi:hypothetical protein